MAFLFQAGAARFLPQSLDGVVFYLSSNRIVCSQDDDMAEIPSLYPGGRLHSGISGVGRPFPSRLKSTVESTARMADWHAFGYHFPGRAPDHTCMPGTYNEKEKLI